MLNLNKKHLVQHHVLPLLFYIVLALLMTWPLVTQFTTAVPGDNVDSWQNMWNMWWLKQALAEGSNPFFTTSIYYPDGTSLLLHTLNPINFLISLPIHALFGLIVAYNFTIIFSLSVSGYAAYLLALDVVRDQRSALVGGVVFACSGYVLAQALGHLNLIAVEFLPFAALALRRVVATPGLYNVVLAAFCIWLNLLCDWQYFLFALLWGGWYTVALAWNKHMFRTAVPIVMVLVLAVLLALPLLLPTALVALTTPQADTGEQYRLAHSADPIDFFIPSQLHPVWGETASQVQGYKEEILIQNKTAYIGIITLVLMILGVQKPGARFWLLSTVLFGVLALGPHLHLWGIDTTVPLPAAFFYKLPFVNISRVPLRFVVLVMLSLCVLTAFGTQRMLTWVAQCAVYPNLSRSLLSAVLLGLVVFDNFTAPFPIVSVYVPPFYAKLGLDSEEYAILEAPFYARTSLSYMLYQAVHGKNLVGGTISRHQPYPLLEQMPIIQIFAYAQPVYDIDGQDRKEIAASVFSYFNIRYLILHSDGGALRYNTLLEVAEAAAGENEPLLVEIPERSFIVYQVSSPEEPLPFIGIGKGWSAPEVLSEDVVQRRIQSAAEIFIYSAKPRDVILELQLYSTNAGRLNISRDEDEALVLDTEAGEQLLQVPLKVRAGKTRLLLRPDGMGDVIVRSVDLEVDD